MSTRQTRIALALLMVLVALGSSAETVLAQNGTIFSGTVTRGGVFPPEGSIVRAYSSDLVLLTQINNSYNPENGVYGVNVLPNGIAVGDTVLFQLFLPAEPASIPVFRAEGDATFSDELIPVMKTVNLFVLLPPAVTSVEPDTVFSNVDTVVTITGSKFVATESDTPAVFIAKTDTIALINVTLVDSTQLTATVPAGVNTGVYDVIVTNPDGQSGVLEAGLTVLAPPQPNIALSDTSLDFGDVELGSSADRTLRIYNVGGLELGVDSLTVDNPEEFSVVSPTSPDTIAVGDSLEVTLRFTPSAVGLRSGTLTIYSNDPDNPDTTVALSGNGVVIPDIALSQISIDFDGVAIGDSSSVALWVYSVGTDTLEVTGLVATGDYSAVPGQTLPAPVAPRDSLEVTVTFKPSVEGPISGMLTITSNDPDSPDTTVALFGDGFGMPEIALSDTLLDFGAVEIDSSASQTLWIYSVGTDTLEVSGLSTTVDYSAESGVSLPALVPPTDSLEVTVAFSPTREGTISGTLTITSNAPDTTVALFGEGFGMPEIALSDTLLDFGVVEIDSSASQTLWIYSVGTDTLEVSGLSTTVDYSAESGVPLPALVPPADSLEVTVIFSPTTEGAISGTLTIIGNVPDTTVVLLGEGFGVPHIALSDTLLDFGNVLKETSAHKQMFIHSVGTDTLEVDSLAAVGEGFSVSPDVPPIQFIAPGDSLGVVVQFTAPADTGAYGGTLTVYSSDLDAPQTTVSLRGMSVESSIWLSTMSLDFGDVLLGDSLCDSLWVYNVSADTLWVDSLTVSPEDYTVLPSVPPAQLLLLGDSLGVAITFTPSVLGEISGNLGVAYRSTLPDSGRIDVSLSGRGVQQDIELSADSLDFGNVQVGFTVSRDLILRNVGTADLAVDSLVSDNLDFVVTYPAQDTLTAGDSAEVFVNFTPSALGLSTGTLTIYSDDPDEPVLAVALSGNGVARPMIVINEVLVDGSAGDANRDGITDAYQDEFIEILNVNSLPINIGGWTLSDDDTGDKFAFPEGTTIAPGEFVLLFGGGDPDTLMARFPNVQVFVDDGRIGNGLADGGDTIYLINPIWPDTVARVTYPGEWGAAAESFTRFPDGSGPDDDPTAFVAHSTVAENGAIFSPGGPVPLLEVITVLPPDTSVAKGLTVQYAAIGNYTDASWLDLTDEVTWASSDPAVATIDTTGLATAVDVGTCDITASWYSVGRDTTITGTAALAVTEKELVSIEVSPADTTIALGLAVQYTAIGTYTDNSQEPITGRVNWASSDTTVATIGPGGLAQSVGEGTTHITASSGPVSSPPAVLNVGPHELVSLAIAPEDTAIVADTLRAVFHTMQYTAVGTYTDGAEIDITSEVFWASSAPSVAVVDSSGLATAVAPGATAISASQGAVSDSTGLIVAALGDVNHDGEVNVADVIRVINIILAKPPEPTDFELVAGDFMTDSAINILDVVGIIRHILDPAWIPGGVARAVAVQAVQVWLPRIVAETDNRVVVPVEVTAYTSIAAAQMRLKYDPNLLVPSAPELTERSKRMALAYNQTGDGELRVVLYSLIGELIPEGSGPILNLPFQRLKDSQRGTSISLEEIILADGEGRAISANLTAVETEVPGSIPLSYLLNQNSPNPFNAKTTIRFELPATSTVTLEVYNLAGQKVRTLVDGTKQAGRYSAVWDGKDEAGRDVASGIYLYRLQADDFIDIKRMVLLK